MPPKAEKEEAKASGEEAEDKKDAGEKAGAKAKGKGKGAASGRKGVLNKQQALAQITSLAPDDDEREATSKKISWILRKENAPRIGINKTKDGWVKLTDLFAAEILEDVPDKSDAKLLSVIEDSNKMKLRYEFKETDDGKLIKAVKREDRKALETGAPPSDSKSKPAVGLQVESTTKLRAETPAFTPAAMGGGYAAASYQGYGYPFGYPWAQMAQAYGYGYPQAAGVAPAAAAQGNKRYTGRIKSYNTEKGYGFVESPEAYQFYQRDVFLHKAHLGSFAVNSFVTFQVEMNKQGMPQARDLAASDGAAMGKGKGKGKGKGEGKKKGEGKGGDKGGEKKPKKAKGEGKKDKDDKDKDKDDKGDDKGKGEAGESSAKEVSEAAAPAAEAPAADKS